MKKLFLVIFFAVSSFSFAHCGTCGVGEKTKSCGSADSSKCSSTAHDQVHKRTPDSSNTPEEPARPVESQAQPQAKESAEQ